MLFLKRVRGASVDLDVVDLVEPVVLGVGGEVLSAQVDGGVGCGAGSVHRLEVDVLRFADGEVHLRDAELVLAVEVGRHGLVLHRGERDFRVLPQRGAFGLEGGELVLLRLRELAMFLGRGVLDLLDVLVEFLHQVNVVRVGDREILDSHDVRVFHGPVEATDAIGERHIRANGGREQGEERMSSRTALSRSQSARSMWASITWRMSTRSPCLSESMGTAVPASATPLPRADSRQASEVWVKGKSPRGSRGLCAAVGPTGCQEGRFAR